MLLATIIFTLLITTVISSPVGNGEEQQCNASNYEIWVLCANCVSTCQTIVSHVSEVKPGCVCQNGYVLDEATKVCITLKEADVKCTNGTTAKFSDILANNSLDGQVIGSVILETRINVADNEKGVVYVPIKNNTLEDLNPQNKNEGAETETTTPSGQNVTEGKSTLNETTTEVTMTHNYTTMNTTLVRKNVTEDENITKVPVKNATTTEGTKETGTTGTTLNVTKVVSESTETTTEIDVGTETTTVLYEDTEATTVLNEDTEATTVLNEDTEATAVLDENMVTSTKVLNVSTLPTKYTTMKPTIANTTNVSRKNNTTAKKQATTQVPTKSSLKDTVSSREESTSLPLLPQDTFETKATQTMITSPTPGTTLGSVSSRATPAVSAATRANGTTPVATTFGTESTFQSTEFGTDITTEAIVDDAETEAANGTEVPNGVGEESTKAASKKYEESTKVPSNKDEESTNVPSNKDEESIEVPTNQVEEESTKVHAKKDEESTKVTTKKDEESLEAPSKTVENSTIRTEGKAIKVPINKEEETTKVPTTKEEETTKVPTKKEEETTKVPTKKIEESMEVPTKQDEESTKVTSKKVEESTETDNPRTTLARTTETRDSDTETTQSTNTTINPKNIAINETNTRENKQEASNKNITAKEPIQTSINDKKQREDGKMDEITTDSPTTINATSATTAYAIIDKYSTISSFEKSEESTIYITSYTNPKNTLKLDKMKERRNQNATADKATQVATETVTILYDPDIRRTKDDKMKVLTKGRNRNRVDQLEASSVADSSSLEETRKLRRTDKVKQQRQQETIPDVVDSQEYEDNNADGDDSSDDSSDSSSSSDDTSK